MSSFGQQIRRERELRKISLEEIAEATKISVRYLRALEQNDFSGLPGGVFDRGYVRAYAQFVGLDQDATVEAYLAERAPEPSEEPEDGLDALRNAVETHAGGRASTAGGAGGGRALRIAAVVIVGVGVVSVAAWALSRYFHAGGPGPAPRAEVARQVERSVEPEPLETSPASLPEPLAPAAENHRTAAPEPGIASGTESPAAPDGEAAPIDARIIVDRAARGRVNCDNRQVEILDGLRPGTALTLRCRKFLLLNVRDGGAVRVGLGGETPLRLVADGEPLDHYGIYP